MGNVPDAVVDVAMQQFLRLVDIAKTMALGGDGKVQHDDPRARVTPKYLRDQLTQAGCLYLACKHAAQSKSLAEVLRACNWTASASSSATVTKKHLGKRVI